jgi:hypothetical protein
MKKYHESITGAAQGVCLVLFALALLLSHGTPLYAETAEWPEITQTALPWTRWWWHGSAVDEENISRCLEQYAAAGLGGVEITCIYGVKGTEDRQLQYLSPEWVKAVIHAAQEAKRLGLGVDLPPGSGWRMGGPRVSLAENNAALELVTPTNGDGHWSIQGHPLHEKVKRPAPGGAGYTINPYSRESVQHYLDDFAEHVEALPPDAIRASFHDSFEYEGNWSERLLTKFAEKRGYRLEEHLPALAGEGDDDEIARVKCDFRETMSDLVHDELIVPWVEWSHEHGQLARNQAHGSPANWLDLYAACDIPETESFGSLDSKDANPLVQKFASSAAHVAGKKLVAAESCTWLNQHFMETLAEIKERLDRQMLAGVNHVFYHGTAYSPTDAEWPGWLFYASTQLNPQNPIWRDLPALNAYVARCQALLQAGEPANDLLIYWPIHDVWHNPQGLRQDLRVHNAGQWFFNEPIGQAAQELDESGVSFDYISDAQVQQCEVEDGRIKTPGASYQAILIPDAKSMPIATLEKLSKFAQDGGKVLFFKRLPENAPGLLTIAKEEKFARALCAAEKHVEVGGDLRQLLAQAEVTADPFTANTPLRSIRHKLDDGWCYFLKNSSKEDFDGLIAIQEPWESALLMDALTGKIGKAEIRDKTFRIQVPSGGTIFVRIFDKMVVDADPWEYIESSSEPTAIEGDWKVKFVSGGPELPGPLSPQQLESWTKLAGEAGEKFAGTAAYEISIAPLKGPGKYLLSLGKVADSARVFLNGQELGVLFASPFQIPIELGSGDNKLRVEVTNVAINRIRDLDRRKVKWQIFDDINIVGIDFKTNKYVPLNTADWPVREAGLLGPVTLTRLAASQD